MKVILAASAPAAGVLGPALRRAGMEVVHLRWRRGVRPQGLEAEGARALVVSALFLGVPAPAVEEELLEFPRQAADAARQAGLRRVVFLLPEVGGLGRRLALAVQAVAAMMGQVEGAGLLRTGFLVGVGGLWGGRRLPAGVLVPGQGHGGVQPVLAEDLAQAVRALLETDRARARVASFREVLPLREYLSLVSGRALRVHVPVSACRLLGLAGGWGLEAEALARQGRVAVAENHLEELTGRPPRPVAELAPGRAPAWLGRLGSSS